MCALAKSQDLLTGLLKDVSRSFYLTLRVMPARVRPQIGLAYLLARTTDTIADTGLVPVTQRLEALQVLRQRILGQRSNPVQFESLSASQGQPAERVLLTRCEEMMACLAQFRPADQQLIQQVLATIASGQELDLQRFGEATSERIIALASMAELDDYTYRVAGCVGEFWTRLCRAHLFPQAPLEEEGLIARGIRFGKGLQAVNILRDLPADLRQGRCYLPSDRLAEHSLHPVDLLQASQMERLRPLYDELLDWATGHLAAGWSYTLALPRRCVRVRLACAWPILIGMKTLARLRQGNVLDASRRIKVRRREVRNTILRSLFLYPWDKAWRGQFESVADSHSP
jgi:farnesyl-diphosphate farnesyltransferase